MSDNCVAELDKTSRGFPLCCPTPPTVVWGTLHSTAIICLVQCGKVQKVVLYIICFRLYLITYIMRCVCYLNQIKMFYIWLFFFIKIAEICLISESSVKICQWNLLCTSFIWPFMRRPTWEYPNRLVRRQFSDTASPLNTRRIAKNVQYVHLTPPLIWIFPTIHMSSMTFKNLALKDIHPQCKRLLFNATQFYQTQPNILSLLSFVSEILGTAPLEWVQP